MKTLWLLVLSAALLFFCACGGNNTEEITPAPSALPTENTQETGEQQQELVQIGFSIAGTGAFYEQLKSDIEAGCAARGYTFSLLTAQTAAQQLSGISALLAEGISVLVIGPADVDALEAALAECESDGVPVINIIDSINGRVSTLVSPDYTLAGRYAAERAQTLFGETGVRCLQLKTDYDSFIMQLLSDGFTKKIAENDTITVVSEQYCGDDEEEAYLVAKSELLSREKNIGFIFAQSPALSRGALRAISDTGSAAKLVAYGGDMDLISAVVSGGLDAAVFIGPRDLADIVLDNAGQYLNNSAFLPEPYIELELDVVTAENAANYFSKALLHAQVKED